MRVVDQWQAVTADKGGCVILWDADSGNRVFTMRSVYPMELTQLAAAATGVSVAIIVALAVAVTVAGEVEVVVVSASITNSL